MFAIGVKVKITNNCDVTLLFVKLGFTLLMFLFVYPILSSDGVSDPATAGAITTFLAVAYRPINDAINGGKFHLFEAEADKVVNDYIARKQQGKKEETAGFELRSR